MAINLNPQTLALLPLSSLGPVVELDFKIDESLFQSEVKELNSFWRSYNPRKNIKRYGLSLTSLDGNDSGIPDLDSIKEFNKENGTNYIESDFKVPTKSYHKISALSSALHYFKEDLGRSHLIRLDQGGHFPPHRDAYIEPSCFRILIPCTNCEKDQFVFLLENKRVELTPWRAYYIDTRLEHSVFSFVDNSVQVVLNVMLSPETVAKALNKVKIK